MKHRSFYDTQRAQPTLRLHSSRFVVESCDVFVGNRTLFEQFGNISTVWEPNESFWSSVDRFSEFRQGWNPVCSLDKNPSLVFVTFKQYLNWTPNDIRWLKPAPGCTIVLLLERVQQPMNFAPTKCMQDVWHFLVRVFWDFWKELQRVHRSGHVESG